MRVKRYVADSIQEAIARVKNDLGRNAIILHTKPFKEGGFFGFFSQRRVEVIAAVDEEPKPSKVEMGQFTAKRLEAVAPGTTGSFEPIHLPRVSGGSYVAAEQQVFKETAAAVNTVEPELNSIREEIAEMKEMIRQVTLKQPISLVSNQHRDSGKWLQLRQSLTEVGLSRELVDGLTANLPEVFDESTPELELLQYCQKSLEASLIFSEPLKTESGQPLIAALIGPTGVGKTTTIAKLAANINLFEGKKVGLITIDTYRIAAVEHLKTYGDIMNLPVEVVYAPADLDQAILNLNGCDLILIDTAGRSPHNQTMMEELHRFLTHHRISEILLVISATTQFQDMIDIEARFAKIAYTHLLFTKLDETACLGPIVSLAWKIKRPISYLTVGQNVPDDIEVAKPDKLIAELFKGIIHG